MRPIVQSTAKETSHWVSLDYAYVDSITHAQIGWFHGVMFFGMAVGPIFGGYLGMVGGKSRPLLIFYTALVGIFHSNFWTVDLANGVSRFYVSLEFYSSSSCLKV